MSHKDPQRSGATSRNISRSRGFSAQVSVRVEATESLFG
uniref:Uncharacterized protein n=1 Tax=Nonomuraea gerenzanensis TaxID=93944 RepID=A0A1M4E4F3_9ACTN|nr:hypothetical protein BN4615_P3178 [Nonomuraea gerenzanensis]